MHKITLSNPYRRLSPLSANPTKRSNTINLSAKADQLFECLTILWFWRLKGLDMHARDFFHFPNLKNLSNQIDQENFWIPRWVPIGNVPLFSKGSLALSIMAFALDFQWSGNEFPTFDSRYLILLVPKVTWFTVYQEVS